MEIKVTVKSVYGNELIYPACDKSRNLAKLAGTKTLTAAHLSVIKDLGYQISEAVTPRTF